MTIYVWIDPSYKYDAAVYEQAIEEFSVGIRKTHAIITFWDNRDMIPTSENKAVIEMLGGNPTMFQIAQYERNRSARHERFFFMKNGDMVEPSGTRPSNTPIPRGAIAK
jgi:hypothetical protein